MSKYRNDTGGGFYQTIPPKKEDQLKEIQKKIMGLMTDWTNAYRYDIEIRAEIESLQNKRVANRKFLDDLEKRKYNLMNLMLEK